MKLIKKFVDKDGTGSITLKPEETEDLWHIYHLVVTGDQLTASTFRRVQKETASGSTESERVKITVTLQVEKVDFNPGSEQMRISGPCITENTHLKLGAYHTIDVQLNANFSLHKQMWDSIALGRVESATNPEKNADAAAVVMNEGLAHIVLITGSMTIPRAKIESSIPRKHKAVITGHEKALHRFFEMVMQGIQRHVNFDIVKAVIIASPGFTKDQFMEYMMAEAQRKEEHAILTNKSKFILVHSSSGQRHALREILTNEVVVSKLADTKAAGEVRVLNEFYEMLKTEPDRAFYGVNHVIAACGRLAIDTLLLADDLFRSADIAARAKYVKLVKDVKEHGGSTHIFSTMHQSGEQLSQLGGIAAILRFPLPDLDDMEEGGKR